MRTIFCEPPGLPQKSCRPGMSCSCSIIPARSKQGVDVHKEGCTGIRLHRLESKAMRVSVNGGVDDQPSPAFAILYISTPSNLPAPSHRNTFYAMPPAPKDTSRTPRKDARCEYCRKQKHRCTPLHQPCVRCREAGIECSFSNSQTTPATGAKRKIEEVGDAPTR